jgi:hypothetical protein
MGPFLKLDSSKDFDPIKFALPLGGYGKKWRGWLILFGDALDGKCLLNVTS